jgi:hypothetical protein
MPSLWSPTAIRRFDSGSSVAVPTNETDVAMISSALPSALPPTSSDDRSPAGPFLDLRGEITSSFLTLWTRYAGKEPTRAHTEIRGNVVTCTLVDSVDDYRRSMAGRQADALLKGAKLGEASYEREAIATVVRLTRQRVISLVSSHDRDTDVATEVFTLEPSLRRGRRPSPAGRK